MELTLHGESFSQGRLGSSLEKGQSVELCLWCGDRATQKVQIGIVFLSKLILKLMQNTFYLI